MEKEMKKTLEELKLEEKSIISYDKQEKKDDNKVQVKGGFRGFGVCY